MEVGCLTTLVGIFVITITAIIVGKIIRNSISHRTGKNLKLDFPEESLSPHPGIKAENVTSHAGSFKADDRTGRGIDVKGIEVRNDVSLISTNFGTIVDPKAPAPA